MGYRVLPKVEDQIKRYQGEHRGERPLYLVMPSDDADHLIAEVRQARGFDQTTVVTELDGTKIIRHPALKPGELQLTDELPETGS
jgi:hypothetical protein